MRIHAAVTHLAAPLLAGTLLAQGPAPAPQVDGFLQRELDSLVDLYQELHRNPEISYREKETSRRMAEQLAAAGCNVIRGIGGYGLVGIMENGKGPVLMLRADLDALPVGERTGLPYMSKIRTETPDGQVAGIMHACGHDIHMTSLVGTARFMGQNKDLWQGTVVFLGQPAEERGGGAKAMIKDGLLDRIPEPDFALALHVWNDLPTGTVGYRSGPAMANVDSVDITVFGRGGHGSTPHLTIDPIAQAAQLIVDLQTIVSREVSPLEAVVVTVGSIHGGTKHNIISDRCKLQLTVRSYSDEVRAKVKAAIERKALAVAKSFRAPKPLVEFSEGVPFLDNDPELTDRIVKSMSKALGEDKVREVAPVMGAEDFALFGRAGIPVCMFRLGTVNPDRLEGYRKEGVNPPGLHSPFYYPDAKESLATGVRATVAASLDLLPKEAR